MNDMHRNSVL